MQRKRAKDYDGGLAKEEKKVKYEKIDGIRQLRYTPENAQKRLLQKTC